MKACRNSCSPSTTGPKRLVGPAESRQFTAEAPVSDDQVTRALGDGILDHPEHPIGRGVADHRAGHHLGVERVTDRRRLNTRLLPPGFRHPRDAGALGWRCPVIRRDDGSRCLGQYLNRGRADAGCAAGDEYPPALQWLCHV